MVSVNPDSTITNNSGTSMENATGDNAPSFTPQQTADTQSAVDIVNNQIGDVGSVDAAGNATVDNGTYTLTAGADIHKTNSIGSPIAGYVYPNNDDVLHIRHIHGDHMTGKMVGPDSHDGVRFHR